MSIHADTRVGPVHLTVRDLEAQVSFYTDRIGLALNGRGAGTARLGAAGPDLLVLWERAQAPRAHGTTGLYHFAILVPSRPALAAALHHLLEQRTPLTGAADHLVSEALYLSDPEGNGIEIYRDRPRGEWPMEGGRVRMATDPLDLDGLLSDREPGGVDSGRLASGTTIGHVHLHVADLEAARRFYVDLLGFDLMQRYGHSALFVSAGGYHHHVGLNTWMGEGAPPSPPGAAGMHHFVVRLPDRAARAAVIARFRAAGVAIESVEEGEALADPSSNRIVLAVG